MCSIRWFSTAETHELLIDFDFFLRGLRNMCCNICTVNRFMRFLVSLDRFEAGCLPNGGSFSLLRDIVLPAAVWRYVEDGCNPNPEQRTTGGEWKRLARCLAVLRPWCARVCMANLVWKVYLEVLAACFFEISLVLSLWARRFSFRTTWMTQDWYHCFQDLSGLSGLSNSSRAQYQPSF